MYRYKVIIHYKDSIDERVMRSDSMFALQAEINEIIVSAEKSNPPKEMMWVEVHKIEK
jgi:hypothetical protein